MYNRWIPNILAIIIFSFSVQALSAQQGVQLSDNLIRTYQEQRVENDSQRSSLLQEIVEIDIRNATVEQALNTVANKANLKLVYSERLLPNDKLISIENKSMTLYDVLWSILDDTGLRFAISSNRLLVLVKNLNAGVIDHLKAFQQTVNGTVTDAQTGEALPGVNVIVVNSQEATGSTIGTTTDMDGQYEIQVPDELNTLVFSFVGYQRTEVQLNGRTEVDVELASDVQLLDDIVVVGYGTVQKSDLTGSVNSISGEQVNVGTQASVDQAIQGRIPGVQVTQTSAEPGGAFSIRIRGTNSITAGNEPLYVIDGLPGANPLNSMNPADIQSIEVLKDASATAIYGARGSNGVILITTKQGQKGTPLEINYNGSVGFQEAAKTLDLMNAQEYMNFYNEVHIDRGNEPPFSQQDFNTIGNGTNWQDEILRTAAIQEHRISFAGGSEDTQYFISANYFNQDGIVIESGFEKITGRVNIVHSLGEKLRVGVNLNNSLEMDNTVPLGLGVNLQSGVVATALQLPPTDPIRDSDGNFAFSLQDLSNSVGLAETVDDFGEIKRLFGNTFAEVNLLENWSARVNLGYNQRTTQRDLFWNTETLRGVLEEGEAVKNFGEQKDYLLEITSEYEQDINPLHKINILGGYSFQRFENSGFNASSQAFPTTSFRSNNLGSGDPTENNVGSFKFENTLLSGFGRLNYNFDDRYLVTGTFRADGSSRFGENNKFAFFPSGAVAWRISNEDFFSSEGGLFSKISDLKLRASFGVSGNQEIGNGRSLVLLGTGPIAVLDGVELQSIAPTQLANPDIKWETTESFDVGLDYGFLDDRITGSIDYFVNNTRDLLLELPIPTTSGFASSLQNVGDTKNSGLEFTISSNNIVGDFSWTTDLNFATLNNEVTNLGELPRILQGGTRFITDFTILREGDAVNSYFGYVFDGVFQSEAEINNSATQSGALVGGRKFKDINGDGVINPEDRTILGDPFPDFTLGFNNSFAFRGFELDLFLEGRFGFELANFTNIDSENPIDDLRNRQRYVLDRWTPSNPTNETPNFVNPSRTFDFNSRVVEDASFLRLKNLRLAYTFPNFNITGINTLSVYGSAQNLFTITDYRGYNPDINVLGTSNVRIDYSAYPLSRIITFGVNMRI